ncbi:hypothetical protein KXD40_007094 [Peronospora effusa]|uniref:Elicitin n=1 Tax=Peronospora effusa TaxID=542832 RepID=A0A3M6V847_9STRA|nr:hypothetical protein DD238_004110 [Peronospora effusa]RQM15450.1 hypothetical protein DD237_003460 [Peronospora effusa]UIZ24747.1 hypothetical protein KXD40_007094 [Peronospora effusa]CAI5700673.1 unnamed protein product [Peronospora effusa]
MKTVFVSALAITLGVAYAATKCDLTAIESSLKSDRKIKNALRTAQSECFEATGYDIFDISVFPTPEQSKDAQLSSSCSQLVNIVNVQANVASQCTIEVNGTTISYGKLVNAFLDGKTGNESDSGSGSVEFPSESDSGSSEDETNSSFSSPTSTSGSVTTALSFVTYGAIAAVAVALH